MELIEFSIDRIFDFTVAELTYRFIEQPFIRRGRRRTERVAQREVAWEESTPLTAGSRS